jgi:hypothetical protein
MVCRQLGTKDNEQSGRGGGMKADFPTQIRSAARTLPAREQKFAAFSRRSTVEILPSFLPTCKNAAKLRGATFS